MRPDEQPAAEAFDGVAVGRELDDDVEIRLEAFVAELVAAGIAAQHGPDVATVKVDVDIADGADLPAAGQLGPTVDEAVRIRQRLRERQPGQQPERQSKRNPLVDLHRDPPLV